MIWASAQRESVRSTHARARGFDPCTAHHRGYDRDIAPRKVCSVFDCGPGANGAIGQILTLTPRPPGLRRLIGMTDVFGKKPEIQLRAHGSGRRELVGDHLE